VGDNDKGGPGRTNDGFTWPEDIPAQCPPDDASPMTTIVYRFVKKDPPSEEDFSRPIDKPRKAQPSADEVCSLFALSVFTEADDIPIARQLIPGFKRRLVAEGRITPNDGVMKPEPIADFGQAVIRSHHDWWLPRDHNPLPAFAMVDL
jgi:hypothetical protein